MAAHRSFDIHKKSEAGADLLNQALTSGEVEKEVLLKLRNRMMREFLDAALWDRYYLKHPPSLEFLLSLFMNPAEAYKKNVRVPKVPGTRAEWGS